MLGYGSLRGSQPCYGPIAVSTFRHANAPDAAKQVPGKQVPEQVAGGPARQGGFGWGCLLGLLEYRLVRGLPAGGEQSEPRTRKQVD